MSIAATTSPAIQLVRPGNRNAAGDAASGVGQATPEHVLSVFAQLLKRTSVTPNAEHGANAGTHRAASSGPAEALAPETLDSTQLAQALAQWLVTWITVQQESTAQPGSTEPSAQDAPATANAPLFAAQSDGAANLAALLTALADSKTPQATPLLRQIQQMLEPHKATLAVQEAKRFADDRAWRERLQTLLHAHEATQGWREAAALLENASAGKGAAALSNLPALPPGLAQWLANLDLDTATASTLPSNAPEAPLWQRLLREWRQSNGAGIAPPTPSALLKPDARSGARTESLTEALSAHDPLSADTQEALPPLIEEKLGLEKRLAQTSGNAESLTRSAGRSIDVPFVTAGAPTAARPALETIHTPMTQPAQWAMETAERLVWHAGQAVHKVELQLNPPHLGKLEVSLQLNQDHLTAHFVAATQAARDALDQALPRLRELLQQSGIQLGQSSVSSNGGNPGGSSPWENPQRAQSAWTSESALSTSTLSAGPESSRPPQLPPTVRVGRNALDAWA
ncbi:flagellar hook-length control protein FliK [Hydrogenophilus thiooxidans]|uniref:flagellar hook-length control protein FliK n=1 Tax=Hydrogenophilus thiooxidans TaxID=2820326 RepID=UPI001C22C83C|nr:flagellar hook-length control protein FliK [Hydrogenophilus thiooxidans]